MSRARGSSAALPLALATLLAGCGQKGPLYLPDKNAAVVTTPPSAPAAPASAAGTAARGEPAAGGQQGEPAAAGQQGASAPQPAAPPKKSDSDQDDDAQTPH